MKNEQLGRFWRKIACKRKENQACLCYLERKQFIQIFQNWIQNLSKLICSILNIIWLISINYSRSEEFKQA